VPRHRGRDQGGRHHDQPARHGRLHDADEIRDFFKRSRASSECQRGRVQHPLPRRPRAGGRELDRLGAGGARQVECTINGIGERAGNAALEEVVMAIRTRQDRLPFSTNINIKEIYPSSELLIKLSGQPAQVNKAVVGRNAFAHEAGIHQDGVLKDRRTYEIMRAEDVGAPWNPLVLGKHSGRHAVQKRCADLGFALEGDALIVVYRALMAIADDRKTISDDDIREAVATGRRVTVTH
jgi:isopropylmalate/homocitrate/citramalate synthase